VNEADDHDEGDELFRLIAKAKHRWEEQPQFHALPGVPFPGDPAARAGARGRLLSASEVAEFLHVSPSWVYSETRAGRIPHVRIGRYVRYRYSSINAWARQLERGGVSAARSEREPK
jgi:excisionase family DNA binding protein